MKLDLIPWFIVAAASLMLIWVSHSYLDLRDEYTAYKAAVQQYRETAVEAAKQREEEHSKNLVAVKEDYEKRIVEINAVALRNYRRMRDDAATRATVTADGWLRTGDVAVVDDDGFLFIVDRAKDLIIVSGFNVFPAEVEAVLAQHPGIEAAAVVGVAHPHTGEAVKAYVVPVAGRSIEEDEVIAFCAEHLARYKCPEKVMFVDEIPTGLGGKVLRRSLR